MMEWHPLTHFAEYVTLQRLHNETTCDTRATLDQLKDLHDDSVWPTTVNGPDTDTPDANARLVISTTHQDGDVWRNMKRWLAEILAAARAQILGKERNMAWNVREDINESWRWAATLPTDIGSCLNTASAARTNLRSFNGLSTTTLHFGNRTSYEGRNSMTELRLQLSYYWSQRQNANMCTRLQRRGLL